MRAYIIPEQSTANELWQLTELADPQVVQSNEVLIGVKAVSVNYRDLLAAKGNYKAALKPNCIPTSDGAGIVLAIGADVSEFNIGDRVVAAFSQSWFDGPPQDRYRATALGGPIDGMLAEKVVLSASGLVKIPDSLSFEEAATLPCAGVTAWHALFETYPPIDTQHTILTLGTGGVSIFAIQLATAAGLYVIGTTSHLDKQEKLKAIGVQDVINYKENTEWQLEVKRLTQNLGVDRVIEVGGAGTLSRSIDALKTGGTVSLIGLLAAPDQPFNPMQILQKNAHIYGVTVGSVAMLKKLIERIEQHQIKPVIDSVFDFEKANDALLKLESGAHFGKIVINIG